MRKSIVDVCHKLYKRGYLVATSGNVSVRTDEGMLITPASTRKDEMSEDKIVSCDETGKPSDDKYRPSSEIEMHRTVYASRPDINAIIHAHPPFCVTCTVAKISLLDMILPELVVYTGPVPTVTYATPGTPEQAEAVKPHIENHNALLLERHGVLVMGRTLWQAYNRLEHLEYAAQIIYLSKSKERFEPLPYGEINKLLDRKHT